MRHLTAILGRSGRSFYDRQMTQHAAAMTYYALMSLFPVALLGLSLLGLLGEYPRTYDAISGYLADVVPEPTYSTLDASLRQAMSDKGTAGAALLVSVVVAFYGTTGALESARRALNVIFDIERGRSFLRRKATDVLSTIALLALVLLALVAVFVGGEFAREVIQVAGMGETVAEVWSVVRWPAAVAVATLAVAMILWVTPDVQHRAFRWITPGAVVAVLCWIVLSAAFSEYVSRFADVSAVYGGFAAFIVLLAWLWLSCVAFLFGAVLDAEIEREKELAEGVPPALTLDRPARH